MNKLNLIVPKNVRYISEWHEYNLINFPFPHILDKVLTGCGYTEYCLRNDQDLILCSPRRMLLENKKKQHRDEVFYFKNDLEKVVGYDISLDISSDSKEAGKILDEENGSRNEDNIKDYQKKVIQLKEEVRNYYLLAKANRRPAKIIVTYDSFRHVREALQELIGFDRFIREFQVVIDEFQSVFIDAKFKSNTELELLNHLRDLMRVCFVSATPMLDKYLDQLDEFKDLPYYQLDWITEDQKRIINPNLNVRASISVFQDAKKIIQSYLEGQYAVESWVGEDGLIHELKSTEAVFYVNSVKSICQIVKRCRLTLDQCNILCAKTSDNENKVMKAFGLTKKDLESLGLISCIGSIPIKSESNKMFTFCTRTVYLGADFYSTCARTFIFSDANVDSLSVDVSLDLPQILGRQRLDENPWKNSADLFVKTSKYLKNKQDFEKYLIEKEGKTVSLLRSYNNAEDGIDKHNLAETYEKMARTFKYRENWVAVNRHAGSDLIPIFNNLMKLSEQRTFDIQQIDYKDRVSIFNALRDRGFNTTDVDSELKIFEGMAQFQDRMRYVCQLGNTLDPMKFDLFLNSIPKDYKNYYNVLGFDGCNSMGYWRVNLETEYQRRIGNQVVSSSVDEEVLSIFNVGDRYTKAWIKNKLSEIYTKVGYKKTPKATDLERWFVIKRCLISNPETGIRDNGFEIISRK